MAFKDLMARIAERRGQGSTGAEGIEGIEGVEGVEGVNGAEGTKGEGAEKKPNKAQQAVGAVAGMMGGVKAPTATEQGDDLATRRLTWLASQNPWGNIKGLGKPLPAQPAAQEAKPKLPQEEEEEEEEEKEPEEGEKNGAEDIGEKLNSRIEDMTAQSVAGARAALDIFDIADGAK